MSPVPVPWSHHYALQWNVGKKGWLLRIFPHDIYVLIRDGTCYLYISEANDTFIDAIRLDTRQKHPLVHYKYILQWVDQLPSVLEYPKNYVDIVDILRYFNQRPRR